MLVECISCCLKIRRRQKKIQKTESRYWLGLIMPAFARQKSTGIKDGSLFYVQIINPVSVKRKLLIHILGNMDNINWSLVRPLSIWKRGHQLNLAEGQLSDKTHINPTREHIRNNPHQTSLHFKKRGGLCVCFCRQRVIEIGLLGRSRRTRQATSLFIDNSLPGRGERVSTGLL